MDLENQVCTLKQGREFDGYGLKAESLFVWVKKDNTWRIVTRERWRTKFWTERIYPAYSCAELGVLLPLDMYYFNGGIYYPKQYSDEPIYFEGIQTHAKADLLLHLLKEKIVNPQDLSL